MRGAYQRKGSSGCQAGAVRDKLIFQKHSEGARDFLARRVPKAACTDPHVQQGAVLSQGLWLRALCSLSWQVAVSGAKQLVSLLSVCPWQAWGRLGGRGAGS